MLGRGEVAPAVSGTGLRFLFGKRSRCGLGVTAAELCFLVGRRADVLPRAQLPPAFIQRSGLRKGGILVFAEEPGL